MSQANVHASIAVKVHLFAHSPVLEFRHVLEVEHLQIVQHSIRVGFGHRVRQHVRFFPIDMIQCFFVCFSLKIRQF